jgi:UDP-N-acetylmuramyl pentapeptide phosphotransferase/UDP-N-acetylglucosamine-1-phosphate transferase
VSFLLVPAGLRGLVRAGHVRVNYRDRELAFPLGAVLVTAAVVSLAPLAFFDERGGLDLLDPGLRQWIAYLLGIAFLGLLDDALGLGSSPDTPRGWRGHATAVLRGELSTGAVKAIGALALAAYVVSGTGNELPAYIADIALLILVTNAFNLLDLRGGRVEKTLLVLVAAFCLAGWTLAPVELLGVFIAPFLVAMYFTLGERAMLGDTGSNLAGAVAGVVLLTQLGETGKLVALAIVLAITVFGEFRSISKTIERFPPLRFIDSLGRAK